MSKDQKAWLIVNPNTGKEAEWRLAAFHEEKGLNTWRRERNENVDPTPEPFEKQVECTPPSRNFGELLRSQTAQADHVAEELENLDTHFVSLIMERNDDAFYMGDLAAYF